MTIDPASKDADFPSIDQKSVAGCHAAIDFTHPSVAIKNAETLADLGMPTVMGTTGWYEKEQEVKSYIEQKDSAFIYASNFSLGMNLFFTILKQISPLIDRFDAYDVAGIEYHHNKKADSPSGTAKTIAEILKNNIDRKKTITYDMVDRVIGKDELHFASLRCGSIPGMHKVILDSEADTIELTHIARNREGFALGAVLAAEWVADKKGFFTVDQMMQSILTQDRQL